MSKRDVKLTGEQWTERMLSADVSEYSYKNPYLLATLYYTEGLSTNDMADLLKCEERTIRRYMNYYGFRRFHKSFAQLVKHYGITRAKQLGEVKFYPLGIHND